MKTFESLPGREAAFIEPMECLAVTRVRNGFVPATRRQVFEELRPLQEPNCPFVNLPEAHKGRWGDGLTARDMEKCVWVRPELVAQVEFLEWTESNHLRHSKLLVCEKTRTLEP